MRRGQRVVLLHPVLRAQVLEVDPARAHRARGHRQHVGLGRIAAEGLDHHVGHLVHDERFGQQRHLDALDGLQVVGRVDLGAQLVQHREVVQPQPHALAVLGCHLARKPPRDADVAEIVDHAAEDVPAFGLHGAIL
jgi:hypothetical protein